MNYVARAILEVAEADSWSAQSTKGRYRVTMMYDGHSMMCDFYYDRTHIASWDSFDMRAVIMEEKYKKQITEGIRGAGYELKEVNLYAKA